MKITFRFRDGSTKSSPDFQGPSEDDYESFWDDFLGTHADAEDLGDSDVSATDDEILVEWFEDPTNPQKIVTDLSSGLKVAVPNYSLWK